MPLLQGGVANLDLRISMFTSKEMSPVDVLLDVRPEHTSTGDRVVLTGCSVRNKLALSSLLTELLSQRCHCVLLSAE